MVKFPGLRTYKRQDCITFRKTSEKFGGLSNMAGGYPLIINDVRILTSEALYQACRFPHLPEVQQIIISERSPMTAKMKSKPYRDNSRPDWDIIRTKIMRWSLQVKLIQNWEKFSNLLLQTGDLPIVEDSRKDDFWGAKPQDDETLIGANVLGRLLMQLREQVKSGEITERTIIKPLSLHNFLLFKREINPVSANQGYCLISSTESFSNTGINQTSVDKTLSNDFSVNYISQEDSQLEDNLNEEIIEIKNQFNKYDAFNIMLPHIENLLERERTAKELADICMVPVTLMRNWLGRAVKIGKVKKLSKPIRYVAENQLSLFN